MSRFFSGVKSGAWTWSNRGGKWGDKSEDNEGGGEGGSKRGCEKEGVSSEYFRGVLVGVSRGCIERVCQRKYGEGVLPWQ